MPYVYSQYSFLTFFIDFIPFFPLFLQEIPIHLLHFPSVFHPNTYSTSRSWLLFPCWLPPLASCTCSFPLHILRQSPSFLFILRDCCMNNVSSIDVSMVGVYNHIIKYVFWHSFLIDEEFYLHYYSGFNVPIFLFHTSSSQFSSR